MKNIFKFFGTILTVVLAAFCMTGCLAEDDLGTADLGLHVKVFFPTKVVAGQPMTINGSGFADATAILFPGVDAEVVVTDFQIVSNDMIRVNAPKGISAEGGKIIVRTESDQAESPLPLTLGETKISGYSANAGDQIDGGSQITIYGTDLEFITGVELLDADGNPALVEDKAFNKKATASLIFTVPKKVYEGTFVGKVYTIDGKVFEMPELTYKPATDGGYWETVEKVIWKNDGSVGAAAWTGGSPYRFAMEGKDGLGECVAEIPAETWEKMKTTPFKVDIQPAGDWFQIRILDGWWKVGNNDANDITPDYEGIVDNGDGTFTFVVDLPSKPDLIPVLDDQHLLFAGDGFTILEMYWEEEVLVPGGGGSSETVVWENDGSLGAADWSAHIYRFCLEGMDTNGECAGEIAAEHWEHMKASPFKVQIQSAGDWWQVRILDGHWTIGNSESNDISPNTPDKFIDNGDGTYTFEVDLQAYPEEGDKLVTIVDEKHLLFAGAGFIIQKIYYE